MTEDELSAVAEDAYDLTPIATEVLQAEIAARGLPVQLKAKPAVTAADINIDDEKVKVCGALSQMSIAGCYF